MRNRSGELSRLLMVAWLLCGLLNSGDTAVTITDPTTTTAPLQQATAIPEDTTAITQVFDVEATSDQAGATVFYTFSVAPDSGMAKFTFDYQTGIVSTIADPQLDAEGDNPYTFTVTASDGVSSTVHAFELPIDNVNEPPVITNLPDAVKINENDNGNYSIFTLQVDDPDHTTFTFNHVVTPPGNGALFEFNKVGFLMEVWLRDGPQLNYEEVRDYNISITVSDGQYTSQPKFLHVEIRDINEAPQFVDTALKANFYEESPIGTTLVTDIGPIRALDPDILKYDTVTYLLEGEYADYFDIQTVNQEAIITLAKRLDREDDENPVNPTFTMHVSAIDRLGLRQNKGKTVDIVVTLIDVNDHPTVCNPTIYQGSITENSPIDTSVLTISCTDSDDVTNFPITYRVNTTGQPDHYFYFPVAAPDQLSARYPMDLEAGSFLTFIVDAVQGAPGDYTTSTVSIEISVVGENDNRPVMSQSFYNFEFRYDAAIGTQVGAVSATDADVTTAVLSYDWVYAVTEFEMGSSNGFITTKQTFVADQKYVYYGHAKDNDIPPDVSTTSPIRIDTFDPTLYLIDFQVVQPVTYFTAEKQQEFEDAISSACPPCFGRISSFESTAGNSAMTTITAYALTDDSTESLQNVGNAKTYIPKETLIDIFTIDAAGTPSSAAALPGFFNFPVVKVTATPFGLTFLEWLLYTPEGNATLGLVIAAAVLALLATLIYIWRTGAFARLFRLCMNFNMGNLCKDCCKPSEPVQHISHPKQSGGDFNVFEFRYRDKPLVPKKKL